MGRLPTRPAASCGPEYKLSNCSGAHGLIIIATDWEDSGLTSIAVLLVPRPQILKRTTRRSQLDLVLEIVNTSPQPGKESGPQAQHIRSAHGTPYRIVSDHT